MLFLVGAVLSVVFFAFGLVIRYARNRPISAGTAMEVGYTSIQLGLVFALMLYPIGYMLSSLAQRGGSLVLQRRDFCQVRPTTSGHPLHRVRQSREGRHSVGRASARTPKVAANGKSNRV